MSDVATPDPSARLERLLRFADLAIQASAASLPVAPPIAPLDAIVPEHQIDSSPPHEQPTPAQVIAAEDRPADPPAAEASGDAVSNSLQAALTALQHSLNDQPVAPAVGLPQHLAAVPEFDQSDFFAMHAEDDAALHDAPALGGAATGATVALPETAALAGEDGGLSALQSAVLAAQPIVAAAAALAGVGATVAVTTQLAQSPVLGEIAETAGHTLDAAVSAVIPVASDLAAIGGSVAPELGSVTIASIGGEGHDALAGLLPAPQANSADLLIIEPHDVAIFDAIGVAEVEHADPLVAVAAHSPIHLAGSGLI